MLTAVGADPAHCGYGTEQVDRCMKDLVSKGINQERPGVEHLGHLLTEKRVIEHPYIGSIKACKRPAIMKLRFDPERSPLEGIPVELREALYRIFLDHADGALRKTGRTWMDFDPLSDAALTRPYPFDAPAVSSLMDRQNPELSMKHRVDCLFEELTWPEAKKR